MTNKIKVGIIGGSGLENSDFLKRSRIKNSISNYGEISSELTISMINDIPVVFLSRHGKDHSINPSNVNYRANIDAIKQEGCTHVLAVTACGSLRGKIKPGDFVFPDQFIDKTTKRISTFFDKEIVKHIPRGEPFNEDIRHSLVKASNVLGFRFHNKGTLVTIEGPRFSTKAEL